MKFDLEERLIRFAVMILDISDRMPTTKAGNHLTSQLIRSGTAPALMYGEVNAAESRADFIRKMGVALKELRETRNCLRIIFLKDYLKGHDSLNDALNEGQQLILIFGKSINTAKQRAGG